MTDFQAKNIIRTRHDPENPYFLMSRRTAQDKNLSYEAQGMLTYLLSQSDSWEIRIDDLQKKGCGRDKVYRILKELKDAGYIHRDQTRTPEGKFIWGDYIVYEHPFTENPYTAKPDTDNQEINTINTKENKEKRTRESKPAPTPKAPIPMPTAKGKELYDAFHDVTEQSHGEEKRTIESFHYKNMEIARRLVDKGYSVEDVTNTTRFKLQGRTTDYKFMFLEQDIPLYKKNQPTMHNTDAYKEYVPPPPVVITEEQKQAALRALAESKAERAKESAA